MMRGFLMVSVLLVSGFGSAQAGVIEDLQQQIDALTKRVEVLEGRVLVVEEKPTHVFFDKDDMPPLENPGVADEPENWARLEVGYSHDEVTELLGKPMSTRRGDTEYWYYSDKGLKGAHVKFLFRKLNSWKAPE